MGYKKEKSSNDRNHRPTRNLLSSVMKPSLTDYQFILQEKINVNVQLPAS